MICFVMIYRFKDDSAAEGLEINELNPPRTHNCVWIWYPLNWTSKHWFLFYVRGERQRQCFAFTMICCERNEHTTSALINDQKSHQYFEDMRVCVYWDILLIYYWSTVVVAVGGHKGFRDIAIDLLNCKCVRMRFAHGNVREYLNKWYDVGGLDEIFMWLWFMYIYRNR